MTQVPRADDAFGYLPELLRVRDTRSAIFLNDDRHVSRAYMTLFNSAAILFHRFDLPIADIIRRAKLIRETVPRVSYLIEGGP